MITRDERQAQTIEKIRQANVWGVVLACTGYGKTKVATDVSDRIQAKQGNIPITVVVPTDVLRTQWRNILDRLGIVNTYVDTVQAIIRENRIIPAGFTIYDEIHVYIKGEQFSKVFQLTESRYKLGLSATLTKEEKALITPYLPIIDTITLDEARRNGWVSDYIQYNLMLDFENDLRIKYNDMHQAINKYYAHFNYDYDNVKRCTHKDGAARYLSDLDKSLGSEYREKYPNSDDFIPRAKLVEKFVMRANQYNLMVRKRQEVLYGAQCKLDAALEVIKALDMKFVTFGQSTDAADRLTAMVNEYYGNKVCRSHHTNVSSTTVEAQVLWYYGLSKPPKTINSRAMIKSIHCSKDRLNKLALLMLEKGDIRGVNTAKTLNMGLDVKGMQLGIILAGTRNTTDQEQRIGRVVRQEIIEGVNDKVAVVVNTIIKDSQDEKWAEARQKNLRGIKKVNSVAELITDYYNYVK